MMRFLTLIEVLELHRQVIEQSGGAVGMRDVGLLESAIVVLEKIWVVVIEAKMIDFSLTKALPQTLSYMLASPNLVTYGLMTNGGEFMFLKLTRKDGITQYATSRVLSLLAPGNELAS